jgi:hypothetical protein
MQITVNIPERIADEARAQGVAVEEFVERLLSEESVEAMPMRDKAEVEGWLKSLVIEHDHLPPLPETITREWIYGDHD